MGKVRKLKGRITFYTRLKKTIIVPARGETGGGEPYSTRGKRRPFKEVNAVITPGRQRRKRLTAVKKEFRGFPGEGGG